ncbi:MAG: acylphosphatase [Alphaproteobacteria bacterium]
MTAVRAVIHGRVQGVGYRDWTRRRAEAADLSGWVRNRREGTVEAVFAGAEDAVRTMLDDCREGPGAARVDRIEEFSAEAPAEAAFRVLATL